jgi:putative DNA primase/helicase
MLASKRILATCNHKRSGVYLFPRVPSAVMDTTNEYFLNEDTFGQWIAENIVRGNDFNFESSSDLYASWSSYADRVGGEPGTQKAFVEAFNNRGYTPHRTNSGRGFKGISLERPNYTGDRRYGS